MCQLTSTVSRPISFIPILQISLNIKTRFLRNSKSGLMLLGLEATDIDFQEIKIRFN